MERPVDGAPAAALPNRPGRRPGEQILRSSMMHTMGPQSQHRRVPQATAATAVLSSARSRPPRPTPSGQFLVPGARRFRALATGSYRVPSFEVEAPWQVAQADESGAGEESAAHRCARQAAQRVGEDRRRCFADQLAPARRPAGMPSW
jgi:hypothetical protein